MNKQKAEWGSMRDNPDSALAYIWSDYTCLWLNDAEFDQQIDELFKTAPYKRLRRSFKRRADKRSIGEMFRDIYRHTQKEKSIMEHWQALLAASGHSLRYRQTGVDPSGYPLLHPTAVPDFVASLNGKANRYVEVKTESKRFGYTTLKVNQLRQYVRHHAYILLVYGLEDHNAEWALIKPDAVRRMLKLDALPYRCFGGGHMAVRVNEQDFGQYFTLHSWNI